jgi:hypothetical protein
MKIIGTIGGVLNLGSDDIHIIYQPGRRFGGDKSSPLPGVPAYEPIGICLMPIEYGS